MDYFMCTSYSLQNFVSEHNREEQFVLLKQRATNIAVQTVCEMARQITQSFVENL